MKKTTTKKPATPKDKREADLIELVKKTKAARDKKLTQAKIRAHEAAQAALDDYRANKHAEQNPEARTFNNLLEALEYLKEGGWKIAKSKIYADQGKIEKQDDDTYTKAALDEYARLSLVQVGSSDTETEDEISKNEEELKILKARRKKAENENKEWDDRYGLKSDHIQELAARAALLKNSVGPEFIHSHAEDFIELVGGDMKKAPELIEFWLKKVEQFFNRYSKPVGFDVPAITGEVE